mmetsp:Transcript_8321/g.21100  ORF Transcript_8321/g.21100 Transcript_8321/m.21100 type:complete len:449 (+) Transcript_8321:85-1431(+)|eukprot:CAMPEP_0117497352 /NCGR_PEP_ID=MMETSP0784-20121206/21139_1 /TAXON_ID=39447 /ORGANISM="" /LENGTH=448 /DNA_ID=CAMNT_0005292373 /DNA_START=64 /DNA_END=1410 /DNA_ORIENTATION=+
MQPLKDSVKQQWSGLSFNWKIGLASLACGLGLWSVSRHVSSRRSHPSVSVSFAPHHYEVDHSEPESLEDALRILESGGSDFTPPPKKASVQRKTKDKTVKAPKKAMAPLKEDAAASDAEADSFLNELLDQIQAGKQAEETEKDAPEKPAAPTKKAARKAASSKARDDALEKLEGSAKKAGARAKSPDDDKSMQDIIDDVLKSIEQEKDSKPSPADIKKAQDIIKDAFGKVEPPEKGRGAKVGKTLENVDSLKDIADGEADAEAADAQDTSHVEFAELLKKEQEMKPEIELKTVKQEFNSVYKSDAKRLMCSGCKLIAARFGTEIDEHDVHDQEAPALMLAAKRRAIDAACKSFRHLDVVTSGDGPRFEAVEAPDGPEGEKKRIGQRLCTGILEDARFDVLMKMMQAKVPSMSHLGANHKTNWERFLCAQRARVCKRNEVRDDDEDEEL